MIVLAGDLGGTNTRLLLADITPDGITTLHEQHYPAAPYDGLQAILDDFLNSPPLYPQQACIAVAGPIKSVGPQHRQAEVTNLPWSLDSNTLSSRCHGIRFQLINDFEAIGYSLASLAEPELLHLQAGNPDSAGTIALIGAGTGLGQAYLNTIDNTHSVHPTEGGHADFSPATEQQDALLKWLRNGSPSVSWEHVLSGSGLLRITRFLSETTPLGASAEFLATLSDDASAAALIGTAAQSGTEPLAIEARRLFMQLYGRQAANLALTTLATGGIYIAGGIAAKNIDAFGEPEFMQGFYMKSAMQGLLHDIPVSVIRTERAGLLGAARCAARLSS